MQAQAGRIVLYSVATRCEENQSNQRLADIGYTHPIKLNDLRKFTACSPNQGIIRGAAPQFESRLRCVEGKFLNFCRKRVK